MQSKTKLYSPNEIGAAVQKFGRFLSSMVMPNIGAFFAWGLITAFFIPTGWLPNASLAKLVQPMITFLLPLLIGYTGGKVVAGERGGVLGAIGTMGIIVGADIPMFIGAMIAGPLSAYCIKLFDRAVEGKIPSGFEMLVNNFSAGIIGALLALLSYIGIGPLVLSFNNILKSGVEQIVSSGLLPLVSVIIEPAKVLFLNNAINHGVLGPIGVQQVKEIGQSIFFLLEANPGPGLGVLLAYFAFSKGMVRQSSSGAIIIHFFGGIHEIYFPYVVMNPALILAVIFGGMSGVFTFGAMNAGLMATPSPGSIFALLAMTPKGGYLAVLSGVSVSAMVSFAIASIIIKRSAGSMDESNLATARSKVQGLKVKTADRQINKIVFACDAGMGSSAMGASSLRNKFQKAGKRVTVINTAIENIPSDADIVVCHRSLLQRVQKAAPFAEHIPVTDFFNNQVFDEVGPLLPSDNQDAGLKADPAAENKSEIHEEGILKIENIRLNLRSIPKEDAIRLAGKLLVSGGYVSEEYIEQMLLREKDVSTCLGQGIAIPHGTSRARNMIFKSGIVVLQFPKGIDFGDDTVFLLIAIAGRGDDHLKILANIAGTIENGDESTMQLLRTTDDADKIFELLTIKA
ncbi:MAG: PTS mannitol transporter subunit IICBA [Oligoflexales bacterium]|nr:PTS mannitol transporter subunit IICBA [Oligoflexales bacterium]